MTSIGKISWPLAVDLFDVELVEVLDLGAREEELCTEGGGVQPDSRWWPLIGGSRGGTGEATRQGYASLKPKKVGQCIAGLLAGAGLLLYKDQLRDGQREFEPKKRLSNQIKDLIIRRNKSLGVICKEN
jgi:hypothetical protein